MGNIFLFHKYLYKLNNKQAKNKNLHTVHQQKYFSEKNENSKVIKICYELGDVKNSSEQCISNFPLL
jgi:hypothetical protein